MSKLLNEIKEELGGGSEEKRVLMQKKLKSVRPYWFFSLVILFLSYLLLYFKLISTTNFSLLIIFAVAVYALAFFKKVSIPNVKEKENTDPALKSRLLVLLLIGVVAIIILIVVYNIFVKINFSL
ncbi:MAG: hypothetical protein ACOYMB_00670 [Patescibacteria group bacterium]